MNPVDRANALLRERPDLRSACEGLTAGEIVDRFGGLVTFAGEHRDALGVVRYPQRVASIPPEATRELRPHELCRCTSPPQLCNCAAGQYDPRDPKREAELIRQAARYGL